MFLDFYRLREQPFGVTPDPAYLYPSRTHCEALDSLTEAILGDRGFLALIAEPGMGKTTLLNQVLDGLRDHARAVFLFQTQCNAREFFQYLMSELGVDTAGMGLVAMHNKLNEILFAEMLAGRRFVLIVDEAQNLDESVLETIRLLSNFETAHAKLMQIVLAGQPQLREKLEQKELSQLLQRITVMKNLEPFSEEETAGYIRHRLKVAGHTGEGLFEPGALELIGVRSQGIPRIINKICFRTLLEGYAAGAEKLSSELVEKAARKLQFVGASRPKQIAVAAPRVDVSAAEVAEVMRIPLTHQLTYQMPGGSRFPSWGIWAAALLFVLLSAGFALPRNVVEGITRKVSEEIKAARNLAGGGESSNSEASLEAKKNGRELSNVTAIHTYDTENGSQVVVLLDGAVQYESARLGSPDRIYFDLHNTRLSSAAGQKANAAEGGLPNWVRAAQNNDDVVRLVLDADGPKNFSAKLLSDPYRLIIDIQGQSHNGVKEELNSSSTPQETVKPEPGLNSLPSGQPSLARELGLKIHRIVIDPGHGGNDTGTMGTHGLLEKNLCLDVALRLGELIEEKIPDAQVIYTRKDDRNIALEERTAMANEANADLFISIHANSSDSRQTRGVETYYVSLATSPESKNLATRENALAESSLHNLPELLKKITRNEKLAESKQLAEYLQNALAERLQLVSPLETNRGVKQAPFIVLIGANMPAVLSEISFVSNTSDENLLLESGQRQRVAEGLYRGIAAYLDSLQSPASSNLKLVRESHSSSTAVGLR